MNDKLLDELLEHLEPRRPRWGIIRGTLRINKVYDLDGVKWDGLTHKELELSLRLLDKDRQIAKLTPKKKTKKAD